MPRDLPNPGIEPRSPALEADSLPAEPQAKPKNTGMVSLSLLQWVFPGQESNWGHLHCRWIRYQLSYEGMITAFIVSQFQCSYQYSESERRSVVSNSLRPCGLYSPWNSLGQNTGVGSLSLCQGIFLTQGSNPCLPYCRRILYPLSHKGSPGILEWIPYPFSRGPFQPRNRTGPSGIAGRSFTN